ncbi:MAG: PP2C family protein-serine/threonine phosphatase, partial [Planctomycetota bacterium]
MLSLATSVVQATAGALYVLREVGKPDSGLRLEQVIGMPESLLANDHAVQEVGPTGMFITAVMVRLERGTRRMTMASAGHNPTLLFRARTGVVESIDGNGPPLGFVDQVEYGECTTCLEPGDVVLLYTDGITEAADDQLEMFGDQRLVALLRQHAAAGAE